MSTDMYVHESQHAANECVHNYSTAQLDWGLCCKHLLYKLAYLANVNKSILNICTLWKFNLQHNTMDRCSAKTIIIYGTVMSLIIRTIQFFEHPTFPSIRTPTFEINIRTPTPRGAPTIVAERLLAFDSLCGARARVTEHLLAYYRHFRISTRVTAELKRGLVNMY